MTEFGQSPSPNRRVPPPRFDDVVRIGSVGSPPAAGPGAIEATRPPRIEDVAREAGVSPITVSRALRSPGLVSPATLERVRHIVRKTGYFSNPHASALRSGRSSVVAAFASNLVSPQYGRAIDACAEVLEAAGYQLMAGQTSYSYARETAAVHSLRALKPAAVFFTGVVELEDNRRLLRDLGVPVMESWAFPRDPIDLLVGISNTDGGRLAAEHFAERGRRRLAFIGRDGGRGRLRRDGFEARAGELGLEVVAVRTIESVRSIADGRATFRELVAGAHGIDAVFCANDLLAIGSVLEARSLGLSLPDDIAVLGMGDSDFAEQMTPALSTVAIDGAEIGRRAGTMLKARLTGMTLEEPICCLPLTITARQSS